MEEKETDLYEDGIYMGPLVLDGEEEIGIINEITISDEDLVDIIYTGND
ncbi:MAG: hypothetical protein FWG68_07045 [Defluviitaleaceae bacterium]|nr:hypothetical protein [Defluviitaleaceae bacterium]